MNREQIIEMAQEAGFGNYAHEARTMFERFFHMAQAVEREACARIAEEWLGPTKDRELHIAQAIRARGQA
jgi:hypothetical protein